MSEHVVIDELLIDISGLKSGSDVAALARQEVYGMKTCRATWGTAFAKYAIRQMFECTGAEDLNQLEVDCLIGKLSENLALSCC